MLMRHGKLVAIVILKPTVSKRVQGLFVGGVPGANTSSGAAMFDVEYARWWAQGRGRHFEPPWRAVPAKGRGSQVRRVPPHHRGLDNPRGAVLPLDRWIQALWKTLLPQLYPLTEQKIGGICNLRQSS